MIFLADLVWISLYVRKLIAGKVSPAVNGQCWVEWGSSMLLMVLLR